MVTPALRPLGIGEVLDRSVTLCVRHFVTLSLIYVVFAIPVGLLTYYAQHDSARMIQIFTDALQTQAHGGPALNPDDILRKINDIQTPDEQLRSLVMLVLLLAILFFASPLPTAAMIEAVTAFYLGRATSFSSAYRVALERYFNLLGLTFMFGLVGAMVAVIVEIFLVLVVLGSVALVTALHAAGVVIAVLVGIVVLVLMIAVAMLVALAVQVALFTCVIERKNLAASFVRGLQRTFGGIGVRRSLLAGTVFVAIYIGITIVAWTGEIVLVGLVHSEVAGTAYETLLRIATAAFTTAFIAVFYVDLRVREEGFDLRLAAEGATPGPPSAPA